MRVFMLVAITCTVAELLSMPFVGALVTDIDTTTLHGSRMMDVKSGNSNASKTTSALTASPTTKSKSKKDKKGTPSPSPTLDSESRNKTDPYADVSRHSFLDALYGGSLAISLLSLIGSASIPLTVYFHNPFQTLTQKFPLYTALVDLFFSVNNCVFLIYTLHHRSIPTGDFCSTVGLLMHFFTSAQWILCTGVAIIVYKFVVWGHTSHSMSDRQKRRLEIAWLTSAIVISLFPVALTAPFGGFGQLTYWCQVDVHTVAGYVNLLLMIVCGFSCVIILTFCYGSVIAKLLTSKWRLRSLSTAPPKRESSLSNATLNPPRRAGSMFEQASTIVKNGHNYHGEVIQKLVFYELAFLVQYLPYIILSIQLLMRAPSIDDGLWLITAWCGCSGGLVNAAVYWYGEGRKWRRSRSQTSPGDDETSFATID